MKELIKIESKDGKQTVNARDLWQGLESKQEFAAWIKNRLDGFIEGSDYVIDKIINNLGGRPTIDYHLTIDTAKHICMLERNEIGKTIRQYFIDVENKSRIVNQLTGPALMAAALIEAHKTLDELKPKAILADRMLNTSNLRTLTDLGKMVSKPRKIFTDMMDKKIIFRRDDTWLPYQEFIDDGYFVVKYNLVKIGSNEIRKPQTYVTAKGERWIIDVLYPPMLKL